MNVQKLQKLAVCKMSARQASKAEIPEKGVITRIILELIDDSRDIQDLKESLGAVNNHVCEMKHFNVWHGRILGPRKFRNKTCCKCKCQRNGDLCECSCGAIWRILMEYRETEFFRQPDAVKRTFNGKEMVIHGKHKKSMRFISKGTTIGDLLTKKFSDSR